MFHINKAFWVNLGRFPRSNELTRKANCAQIMADGVEIVDDIGLFLTSFFKKFPAAQHAHRVG